MKKRLNWRALYTPDDREWWDKPSYSPEAANALIEAYILMFESDGSDGATARFLMAANLVAPFLEREVYFQQSLRIRWVVASAHGANHDNLAALYWVDQALDVAILHDASDCLPELLILRANLNRCMSRMMDAADDMRDALLVVSEEYAAHSDALTNEDYEYELILRSKLAMYQFFAGQPIDLAETLESVRLLPLSDTSNVLTELGHIEWVRALEQRLKGAPFYAYRHAVSAATVYEHAQATNSKDRIGFLLGDIMLDMAEQLKAATHRLARRRQQMLDGAREQFDDAREVALRANDESGQLLVRLGVVRLRRLTDPGYDPFHELHEIFASSRYIGDQALVAQALIALGNEYLVIDDHDSAARYYHEAIEFLHDSQLRVYDLIARRQLAQCQPTPAREIAPAIPPSAAPDDDN